MKIPKPSKRAEKVVEYELVNGLAYLEESWNADKIGPNGLVKIEVIDECRS